MIDVRHTLAAESRIPGRCHKRIRPLQSTSVVGSLNGPIVGLGKLDISATSTGAGATGASAGTLCPTDAVAKSSASHGRATARSQWIAYAGNCWTRHN